MSFSEVCKLAKRVQTTRKGCAYKALVLEGGGGKGMAYWGLIHSLRENGVDRGIHFFSGSSIGALFALIFALDIDLETLDKIMMETEFNDLIDVRGPWLWKVIKGFFRWGIDDGSKVEALLKRIISLRYEGDPAAMTFRELKELTGNTLAVTGSNLNARRGKVFSATRTPEKCVCKCVRISMSYPGAFEPVLDDGDLWADGGIYDNFPVKEALKHFPREDILGAKLLTPDETTLDPDSIYSGRRDIKSELDLGVAIVETMQNARENMDLVPGFWDNTIALRVDSRSIFEISFTREQKEEFKANAMREANEFLAEKGLRVDETAAR